MNATSSALTTNKHKQGMFPSYLETRDSKIAVWDKITYPAKLISCQRRQLKEMLQWKMSETEFLLESAAVESGCGLRK